MCYSVSSHSKIKENYIHTQRAHFTFLVSFCQQSALRSLDLRTFCTTLLICMQCYYWLRKLDCINRSFELLIDTYNTPLVVLMYLIAKLNSNSVSSLADKYVIYSLHEIILTHDCSRWSDPSLFSDHIPISPFSKMKTNVLFFHNFFAVTAYSNHGSKAPLILYLHSE